MELKNDLHWLDVPLGWLLMLFLVALGCVLLLWERLRRAAATCRRWHACRTICCVCHSRTSGAPWAKITSHGMCLDCYVDKLIEDEAASRRSEFSGAQRRPATAGEDRRETRAAAAPDSWSSE